MGKRSEEGVLYKGWCAHGPFGFVWFVHRLLESQVGDHDTSNFKDDKGYDYSNYENRRVHMRCVIRVKECV
jgi:hypothetical protein